MSTQVNGRGLRSAKNIQRSGSEWESFFREWNGTGIFFFFVGVGWEMFKNPLPCQPLVWKLVAKLG